MKISKSHLDFIKSTSTVLAVSSVIGLGCQLAGSRFLPGFLLSMAVQYVLFMAVIGIIKNYFAYQIRQKELDVLEPLSTLLECAVCKAPNIVTFLPDQNERVEFECQKCTRKNVVNISFVVAAVTEFDTPMSLSNPSLKPSLQ